jgi:hypothetical protein
MTELLAWVRPRGGSVLRATLRGQVPDLPACKLRRRGFALVAQRIEQKTSRLQTLPATSYELERSGGDVACRASGVRPICCGLASSVPGQGALRE